MPHDWNAAQVDNKPPGYGQGAGFTVTGPQRLVIIASAFPPTYDAWNYECLPPYQMGWTSATRYQAIWRGQFSDHKTGVIYQQNTVVPYQSSWTLWQGVSLANAQRGARRVEPQFLWPRYSWDMEWTLPFQGIVSIHRMPEWDVVSRRYPAVTIGEEF